MIHFTDLPSVRSLALGGVILMVFLSFYYGRLIGRVKWPWRLALLTLRGLTLALVAMCWFNPERVEERIRQPKARLAVLLDTSRSMATQDVPGSRLSAAVDWVTKTLVPSMPSSVQLDSFSFDESLLPLTALHSASPTGTVTAIARALEQLTAQPSEDPLLGVVLCSDGIDTEAKDTEAIARSYRRKGIPIHTITVGTTHEMRDVVVESVHVKRVTPNAAPTQVTLALRSPGFAGTTVPVRIVQNDRIVATKDVRLNGRDERVQIEFTPSEKGFQRYAVVIPPQTGEWLASNNRRPFGMEVIDPTVRVLYLEGTPQQPGVPVPEWTYLKEALESDPNIQVKVLVRVKSAAGKRIEPGSKDPETGKSVYPVEHAKHGFPKTIEELLKYDVIIHSDILKESFNPAQLQNIARFVEEHGGGFVMIGGASAFGKGGYHKTVLDRIIPVAMDQSEDSETRSIQLQVPGGMWKHPLLALGATREETQAIWTTKLPKLYGCNQVDRAKPGATVLGMDPTRRNASGPMVLLAVQQLGRGRSMAFTSDTTRAWGRDFETLWGERIRSAEPLSEDNCDGRYFRQFWVNAVRWLAAAKLGQTNTGVNLELDRNDVFLEGSVTARVTVRDQARHEVTQARVMIEWSTLEGKTNRVTATYDPSSRSYRARLQPDDAGDTIVTASATLDDQTLGRDQQLLICRSSDRELENVQAQPEWMSRLAMLSEGQVLDPARGDANVLDALLTHRPKAVVEYDRRALWDKSVWLTLILALLATEWAVRRWQGMA